MHGFHAKAKNCLILSGLFDGLDNSKVGKNILSSDIFLKKAGFEGKFIAVSSYSYYRMAINDKGNRDERKFG